MPFKFEAAKLATQTSDRGLLAQACNILSFKDGQILGDNTDGIGLVIDIERNFGLQLKGLRLLNSMEPGVPRVIHTDRGRLHQILRNLLSNALNGRFGSLGAVCSGSKARCTL